MKKWDRVRQLSMIGMGNALYALAVCMFIVPNGLITGGSTGIALFVSRMTGCPVSSFTAVFNGIMFAAGWYVLGREFALTTALSTVIFPAMLSVLERIPGVAVVTDTPMLAVLFAGLLIGCGIGLTVRAGASTGGMDIPPLILKKKCNLNVSMTMYGFDFTILLMQMASADVMGVLYGILLVLVYTVVLDRVLVMGAGKMQVQIVSEKYEEINRCLTDRLDVGTTLIKARTGYLGNEWMTVMTVVWARDLPRVNRAALEIDPEAFIIVGQINEVKGRGYTMDRVYKDVVRTENAAK
ncbi:MAG: YitT family protein [Clostridia bacterium]|nr:YitT family protein [Clostridia bacterium]